MQLVSCFVTDIAQTHCVAAFRILILLSPCLQILSCLRSYYYAPEVFFGLEQARFSEVILPLGAFGSVREFRICGVSYSFSCPISNLAGI